MDRNEALKYISLLLGGSLAGANIFLTGCKAGDTQLFTSADIACLDEIAETILPATKTPGAKAAHVGEFMTLMVNDCYDDKEREIFRKGIGTLNDTSLAKFNGSFLQITAAQRHSLLIDVDNEQKKYTMDKKQEQPVHYFRMMKELTLLGYFTSEPGCTKAKRYMPVPGRYIGCVDYNKGDKAIV